jgi:hypothetical protein
VAQARDMLREYQLDALERWLTADHGHPLDYESVRT